MHILQQPGNITFLITECAPQVRAANLRLKLNAQASTAREYNVPDHQVCTVSTSSEFKRETDCTGFNSPGTQRS